MNDKYGLKAAADRGIKLGDIGDKILLENEFVRVWEVKLEPGETLGFHIHYHPYLVLSLSGGTNEIETIFGKKIPTEEPAGSYVFINEMREVHRLTNKSNVTYLSRLIEMKSVTWTAA
jgi:quercetin dioxygenase-like cupin family protein